MGDPWLGLRVSVGVPSLILWPIRMGQRDRVRADGCRARVQGFYRFGYHQKFLNMEFLRSAIFFFWIRVGDYIIS